MKLYSIMICKVAPGEEREPLILVSATDVSDVGRFQRSAAREFLTFFTRTVSKRMEPLSRVQITDKGRMLFGHSFAGGQLVASAIADEGYNMRVAFNMLADIEQNFMDAFRSHWEAANRDCALTWPYAEATLAKYQKPEEVDQVLKLRKEIEETQLTMHSTIEQALMRGEKLDHLVDASADLGVASKAFYKGAKATNPICCIVA
jgi:synaptobrevin family protein YKT6